MVSKSNVLSPLFLSNATATTKIYTLSLHDALPISIAAAGRPHQRGHRGSGRRRTTARRHRPNAFGGRQRSEEHTSELQSQSNLVCRLLLEKKKSARGRPWSTMGTTN